MTLTDRQRAIAFLWTLLASLWAAQAMYCAFLHNLPYLIVGVIGVQLSWFMAAKTLRLLS